MIIIVENVIVRMVLMMF